MSVPLIRFNKNQNDKNGDVVLATASAEDLAADRVCACLSVFMCCVLVRAKLCIESESGRHLKENERSIEKAKAGRK